MMTKPYKRNQQLRIELPKVTSQMGCLVMTTLKIHVSFDIHLH